MQIETGPLGTIEIDDSRIINMVEPLPGIGEARFALIDLNPESPVKLLQSVASAGLCFMVGDPKAFFPDYSIEIRGGDVADIGLDDPGKAAVLVMMNVGAGEGGIMTANLKAPIIVNAADMKGKQVILTGTDYRTDQPVELAKS